MKNTLLMLLMACSVICKAQSFVELEITTGADDLAHRDFQNGLEIRILIQGKPDVVMLNANGRATWPNNSVRRIRVALDQTTIATQIKEIQLHRRAGASLNNLEAAVADNWNLQKLVATANIVRGGNTLIYNLVNQQGTGGKALFRFVYENRGPSDGQEKGYSKSFAVVAPVLVSGSETLPTITLKALFGTGGDDLRGGGDNVDMVIRYRNSSVVTTLSNVNNNRNWKNFTTTNYQKVLPPNTDINNIESIDVRHTGGGGFAADNWYLDKFKVTIVVNGVETVILDKEGKPVHHFTGDTRKKTFRLQP